MARKRRKQSARLQDRKKLRARLMKCLESGLSITASCEVVGISKETFYKWRREDPEFHEQCKAAIDRGVECRMEMLEDEGIRRAMASSDGLLKFFLEKAHARYRQLPQEHKHEVLLKWDMESAKSE